MPPDLQIEEDLEFERRAWRIQRIGWVVALGIVVVGFLGLFGDGPLARTTLRTDDETLEVRAQRFERHRSPSAVVFTVRPAPGEETVELWMDEGFAKDQTFETIHPEPSSVTVADGRYLYEFEIEPNQPAVRISFNGFPEGIGSRTVKLGLGDGPSLSFRQFVFP